MTMTTAPARIEIQTHVSRPLRWLDPAILRDVLRLELVAATIAIGEALSWPVLVLLLSGGASAPSAWFGIAASGWQFLAVTAPVMGIWLFGAVLTKRAIRQLGGINAGDRAAIAELHCMLARQ